MVSMSASPSAAKACPENKPVIAAVNRCATQSQVLNRLLSAPPVVSVTVKNKPRVILPH